jgi:hypothetical protein
MNIFRNRVTGAGLISAVAALVLLATPALAGWGPATPNFNLEAILRPAAGGPDGAFGLVKFRQPKDGDKIVDLDVWLRGLTPNRGYRLQRATDTNVNDDCTGTNWLTLGQGTDPTTTTITTDDRGTGRADLFRDLAAIPLGTEFDIQFRVIDAGTSAVVLQSACYQYRVSQ